nr:uncharacterized protein LOC108079551 [Drosophila kikkawai]
MCQISCLRHRFDAVRQWKRVCHAVLGVNMYQKLDSQPLLRLICKGFADKTSCSDSSNLHCRRLETGSPQTESETEVTPPGLGAVPVRGRVHIAVPWYDMDLEVGTACSWHCVT